MLGERLVLKGHVAFYDFKDSIAVSSDLQLKNLHFKIRQHLIEQNKNYNKPSYPRYQGYDRIKWSGLRKTEKRAENYSLKKYLKRDFQVLDIGCNTGFISLETAGFVRSVDGLDINPYLIKIAQDVAKFLGITNTCFFICGIDL